MSMLYLLLITLWSLYFLEEMMGGPQRQSRPFGEEKHISPARTFWRKYNRLQWKCLSTVCQHLEN